MNNDDYWKERYKALWDEAGKRESEIAELIRASTSLAVKFVGLGTGTGEYISGNAQSHGFEKGGADLWIVDTNIYLEVTGPLTDAVKPHAALWIRPDKVENALKHLADHETWVVHCLKLNHLRRVIALDDVFQSYYSRGVFKLVHPKINGAMETYLEIPSGHVVVKPFAYLLDRLKSLHGQT